MRRLLYLIFAIAIANTGSSQVTLDAPQPDGVVLAPVVIFRGGGTNGASVTIRSNGATLTGAVAGGGWSIDVPLQSGFNAIAATLGAQVMIVPVTRANSIAALPLPQQVQFIWEEGIDDELKRVAATTLTRSINVAGANVPRTLSAAEQDQFVNGVKARIVELFTNAFQSTGAVALTNSSGPDVHIVRFTSINLNVFGDQLPDCGNRIAAQESRVSVGYLRHRLTSDFASWKPMDLTDSLDVRIEDIAESLARTAAHEVGHALGLVQESGDCGWMNGCDDFHACQPFQVQNPGVFRFDFGHFIMDPGGLTDNHTRLGEGSQKRSAQRSPAVFSEFDRTYIRLILPAP